MINLIDVLVNGCETVNGAGTICPEGYSSDGYLATDETPTCSFQYTNGGNVVDLRYTHKSINHK